jgi:hypothetical protein
MLEKETRSKDGLRRHVPISIVKEILRAKEKGWDPSRISSEYKVDQSVVQKLDKHFAIPVEGADGVVFFFNICDLIDSRVFGPRNDIHAKIYMKYTTYNDYHP